jgi:hypothetical protein
MAGKGTIQAERLKSFIERIERLEEERAALTGDIREVAWMRPTGRSSRPCSTSICRRSGSRAEASHRRWFLR